MRGADPQTGLTRIFDVWGDTHYVQSSELADMTKPFLTLYTKTGIPKKSRQGFPVATFKNVRIHRDNIASIVRAA